jgi:hypothetical protein
MVGFRKYQHFTMTLPPSTMAQAGTNQKASFVVPSMRAEEEKANLQ